MQQSHLRLDHGESIRSVLMDRDAGVCLLRRNSAKDRLAMRVLRKLEFAISFALALVLGSTFMTGSVATVASECHIRTIDDLSIVSLPSGTAHFTGKQLAGSNGNIPSIWHGTLNSTESAN